MTRLLTLLLLSACSTAPIPAPEPVEVPQPSLAESVVQMEELLAGLEQLDPWDRAEGGYAIDAMTADSPQIRLTHQLTRVMQREVQAARSCDDGDHEARWALLRRGLAAHVAALDLLDVDQPLPSFGDHLFLRGEGVTIDLATLEAAVDPIAASVPLVEQLDALGDPPPEVMERVLEQARRAERALGQRPWFDRELRAWTRALRELAPHVKEPHARERIPRLLALLEELEAQGC